MLTICFTNQVLIAKHYHVLLIYISLIYIPPLFYFKFNHCLFVRNIYISFRTDFIPWHKYITNTQLSEIW